jgi:hypothetical protein
VATGIVWMHFVLYNKHNRSAGQNEAHNMPAFNLTHYAPLKRNPKWYMARSAAQDMYWQTVCIKKNTQTINIEYWCGCTYLKICADQRLRPKVMTTHRPVINGQPRYIIE